MSADLTLRLRSLTQDYHDGRLNFATYRLMRAALLDSLVSGAVSAVNAAAAAAVAATQPRAGNWQQQTDAITRPGKPRVASGPERVAAAVSESISSAVAQSPKSGWTSGADAGAAAPANLSSARSSGAWAAQTCGATNAGASPASVADDALPKRVPFIAIAIGIAVLAIAGVGTWLWLGRTSSDAESPSGAPTAVEQGRIHELLTQFTDRADWSDAHLATLNADLLELGSTSLSESAGEPWFQRFVDEVRQRLKEQQALAATPLSADNSPLAALAVTVGLDLNAPDAAIHIAAIPTAHRVEETASVAPVANVAVARASPVLDERKNPSSAMTSTPTADANDRAKPAPPIAAATATSAPKAESTVTAQPDTHEGACRVELVGTRRFACHDLLSATGAEGPPLALIPAGAFDMGGTAAPEEQPVHRVTIRAPFAISINEVSQGEFKQFCAQTERACPKQPWTGDDYPMVNVSWDDARAYAAWLSGVTHHRYTLPTEAQWEYAARAGRTGLFPSGDTLSPTDAHYSMLAKQTAAATRSQKFNANGFRLLHTLGNVREWVEDAWAPTFAGAPVDGTALGAQPATSPAATLQSASTQAAGAPASASPSSQQRVARGGSYADNAARLRLSLREGLPANTRDTTTGFRIVRELP